MRKIKTSLVAISLAALLIQGCSLGKSETVTITLDNDSTSTVSVVKTSDSEGVSIVQTSITEEDIKNATAVKDGEKITKAGTYVLSGEYTKTVTVEADKEDDVIIILSGATVTSEDGPAICASKCKSLTVYLVDGTVNTLTDAAEYEDTSDSAPTGALFCKNDLTIEGTGTLVINGNNKHGIVSKDNLYINGGTIEVSAKKDGLHGGDSLTVNAGTITIKESNEGIEAELITINGGTIDVTAKDDGINVTSDETAPVITINGGTVIVNSNGDGLDSNGNIELNGGFVYVSGATNDGNASVDYDGTFMANGGTLISTGMSGMYQSVTNGSSNYVIDYMPGTTIEAGTKCALYDGNTVIVEFEVLKNANSILITAAELKDGKEYTLKVGDNSETVTAGESTLKGFGGFGGPGGDFNPGERPDFGDASGNEGFGKGMGPGGDFGGERPEGFELPEGFDGELPEGFDGNLPEGFNPPEGMTPPGGFGGGKGGKGSSDDKNS